MNNAITSRVFYLLTISILCGTLQAQEIKPKREFRGAWVATVANIDFPSVPGLSKDKLESEWLSTIDYLKDAGLNAVFAQIRPAGDAFYPSKIAPWSKYLTGKSGGAPREKYDPVAMMIESSHERNLEFHAWINPYRAAMDTLVNQFGEKHPYHQHPEWFIIYGGRMYFNPALPEVRNYLTEVVLEIIMKYDVDGIHFDDYFYPYPAAGELFPDSEDFAKYGYGYSSIDDWRRSNVNALVAQVSAMIKSAAPHVKFGISPFGVWRNNSVDANGSPTNASITAYDDLYADVLHWLQKDWIDYVVPQIYWHIGFSIADYELLVDWWQQHLYGKQLYIGHAAYKVGTNSDPSWQNANQIPRQVSLNRMIPNVQGSLYFNTNSLKKNLQGMTDSLKFHYYKSTAIWPEMAHLNLPKSNAPSLEKIKYKKGKLSMKVNADEHAHYLIVYKFDDRRPGDYNNPENIFKIVKMNGRKSTHVTFDSPQKGKNYTFAVSAANRQHSESELSEWRAVNIGNRRAKKIK